MAKHGANAAQPRSILKTSSRNLVAKGAFSTTSPRSQNSEDPASGALRSAGQASTLLGSGHTLPSPHNPTSPTSPISEARVMLAATLEAAPLPGVAHAPQPLYAHHAAAAPASAPHNGPQGGISSQAGTFHNRPPHERPPAHIPRDAAAVRRARIASVDAALGAETLPSLTDGVQDSTVVCVETVVVTPLTFEPDLSRARSLAREAASEEAENIEYLEFGSSSNGGDKGQRQQKKEKHKPLSRQGGGQYGRSSSSPLPHTTGDGRSGSVLQRLLRRAAGAFGSLRSSASSRSGCSGSGGGCGGGGQARSGGSRLGLGQQSSRSMRLRARVEADDEDEDGDEPVQMVRALNSIVVHKRRQRLGMDANRGSARARGAVGVRAGAQVGEQLGKGAATADQGAAWLNPLVDEDAEAAFTALMLGEGQGPTIPAGRMGADREEDGGSVAWRV